jgi:hypothetical protein
MSSPKKLVAGRFFDSDSIIASTPAHSAARESCRCGSAPLPFGSRRLLVKNPTSPAVRREGEDTGTAGGGDAKLMIQ